MTTRPTPHAGINEIEPYVPGRAKADGRGRTVKLSSNESPLGASPAAMTAYTALATDLASYPHGGARALREAIAETHGIDADRIVCGAGSDELLHLIAQVYIGPGEEAVVSQYGFLVYPIVTRAARGVPVMAPETNYTTDIDAVLAAVTESTRVVFIANPNNPTGSYLGETDLIRLHAGLPAEVLLVVDAAYAEYVTAEDYTAGIELVERNANVVMVRTFSKVGLAGLRVGWLYGDPSLVDAINRIRGPFNVSAPAQAAAAAAVRDTAFTAKLRDHNEKWRDWLTESLSANWMRVLPSQGNFVLVLFADEPGRTAEDANRALLNAGIVVRDMAAYGLPNALRISIGTEEAMRQLADILNGMAADD